MVLRIKENLIIKSIIHFSFLLLPKLIKFKLHKLQPIIFIIWLLWLNSFYFYLTLIFLSITKNYQTTIFNYP